MNALPKDCVEQILRLLPLNELIKCRLANKATCSLVDSILDQVKHIQVRDRDNYLPPLTAGYLFTKNEYVLTAWVGRDVSLDKLLRFIQEHCRRIISLDAIEEWAHMHRFKDIGENLVYFAFTYLKMDRESPLNAQFLVKNFPSLKAFDIPRSNMHHNLCHSQVMIDMNGQEDGKTNQQFIQLIDSCSLHEPYGSGHCLLLPAQIPRSIRAISCFNIGVQSTFKIQSLSTSVLEGIELLEIHGSAPGDLSVISLPNLQYLFIALPLISLDQVVQMLLRKPKHRSFNREQMKATKVRRFEVYGRIVKKNAASLRLLIERSPDLIYFSVTRYNLPCTTLEELTPGGEAHNENQPTDQFSFPFASCPKLIYLVLDSKIPIMIEDARSERLKTLSLRGPLKDECDFNFPFLLNFYYRITDSQQRISQIIRSLCQSTLIKVIHIESLSASIRIDSSSVQEMVSLLRLTLSIRDFILTVRGVYRPTGQPNPPEPFKLDLRPLRELKRFTWNIEGFPLDFIIEWRETFKHKMQDSGHLRVQRVYGSDYQYEFPENAIIESLPVRSSS